MKSKWRVLALIIVTFVGFIFLRNEVVDKFFGGPQIRVDPAQLDFGTTWVQTDFRWSPEVRNPTHREVRVANILVSCPSCTTVSPSSFVLPPFSKRNIDVRMDFSKFPLGIEGKHQLQFGVTLQPIVDGSYNAKTEGFRVHGIVNSPYEVSTRSINFGERVQQEFPLPRQHLRVRTELDIRTLLVECDESDLSTVSRPIDSGRFEIEITFPRSLPIGPFERTILLNGVLASGERLPAFPIWVTGIIVKDLYAFPDSIMLTGASAVPERRDDIISIRSRSGKKRGQVTVDATMLAKSGIKLEGVMAPNSGSECIASYSVSATDLSRYSHIPVYFSVSDTEDGSVTDSVSADVYVVP